MRRTRMNELRSASAHGARAPEIRAMDKSPDAFRTISEVAEDLDLPQHVLRFWETRFPQIKPLKRGGGRRYYRPDDVDLLRGIRQLLYGEGYTIRGVQRILHEQGLRFVVSAGRGELATSEGNGNGNGLAARHGEAVMPFVLDRLASESDEPTFHPREFRPLPHLDVHGNGGDGANGSNGNVESPGSSERLSGDE